MHTTVPTFSASASHSYFLLYFTHVKSVSKISDTGNPAFVVLTSGLEISRPEIYVENISEYSVTTVKVIDRALDHIIMRKNFQVILE